MIVFIVGQEWNSPYDGTEYNIIEVYDSLEKAQSKLQKLYEEDIEWMKSHNIDESDLEENTAEPSYSYVMCGEYYSMNFIEQKQVL